MIKKKKKLHSKFLTKGEMGATLIPPPPLLNWAIKYFRPYHVLTPLEFQ